MNDDVERAISISTVLAVHTVRTNCIERNDLMMRGEVVKWCGVVCLCVRLSRQTLRATMLVEHNPINNTNFLLHCVLVQYTYS